MPDLEAPPAPTQDVSKTPTLLETLASTMDLSDAPQIKGRSLPPIGIEPDKKEKKKPEEKQEEPKPKEEPPKPDEEPAPKKKEDEAQLQKDAETISDKLFKKRTSKEVVKPAGDKKGTADAQSTEDPPPVKPGDAKPKDEKPPDKPKTRRTVPALDEAAITERAASAAATAATRAVSDAMSKGGAKPTDKLEKGPEDKLSSEERKQFVVYKELEQLDPARYKGVSERYLKSLDEISDYVKTWSKENPGVKFDPDDEQHNTFFERVEPAVDEDDWVDAKANLRARDIAARAIAPVNEKMQQMERDRARTALEPFIQQKQLEAVHHFVEHLEPETAATIRKPEGMKELREKNPIAASVLTDHAEMLGHLAAETIRLHDPMAGVEYSPTSAAHREIADFIVGQERRISALSPQDKERDGKMFISRLQYQQLPEDQRSRYWYLNQDDVIQLLAQKYAAQAKKLRDERIEQFNKTAESLGYKKIDAPNPAPKKEEPKPKEQPKPKDNPPSPEAVSRASVKTTGSATPPPNDDIAGAIVGTLFNRLRSS